MITDIKKFTATFNRLVQTKSEDTVFNDYLDMVICALSLGQYEEEYRSIVKRYKREEVDIFCDMLADMLIVMDNEGTGLKDCLGEFFQHHISRGKNGQFFTPEHICDAMAEMLVNKEEKDKTILDPCCGSGRMLLGAAKVARQNHFFGADLDNRCVKMTAINLCLNSLSGEVAWMNTLSGEHWGGYTIIYTKAYPRIPIIRKLSANEGVIYNGAPFNTKQDSHATKIITLTQGKLNLE